jgi:hypothetical protein
MSEVFDNPFAIRATGRRRPLASSLKGLLIVAGLFVAVVVIQSQSRQWLLHRWVSGFAELPVGEQIERLLQIDSLGDVATETLTRRIAAADDRVAATAYELVREHQSSWSARDDDSLARAHARMLSGLAAIIDDLPPNRIAWVTQLLNQTIIECVDQRGRQMTETYASASALSSRLGGDNSVAVTTHTIANRDADAESFSPPSLVPLPVRMQQLDADSDLYSDAAIAISTEPPAILARGAHSGEPMMVVTTGPEQAVHRVATEAPAQLPEPTRMLTSNSLQTFDTKSVIGLLASKQAAMRDQAVEELVRRGLSNEEIRVANQLAAPQIEVRLGLLESIVRRTDLDPRPWLLWLAEDPNREVRLRAVSALAAMNDQAVTQTLRKRLAIEADPAVIAQIRQVVDTRH